MSGPAGPWEPWEPAWARALYGPAGFYRRPEGPAGHFRTASHAAAPELAAALGRLATELGCTAVVDVGAGRGELLAALAGLPPGAAPARLHGVDVVGRPPGLPAAVGWSAAPDPPPPDALAGALVLAWELLDVVPCPVLELDGEGRARLVEVQPATGRERLGAPAGTDDLGWCARWWPVDGPEAGEGDRIEVGRPRDLVWTGLVRGGLAAGARAFLAVDYAHDLGSRPAAGSLTGFRAGRAVPPRPDGSTDVTAHVALDAVAAAGRAAGITGTERSTQHAVLRELGVRDPELLDPGGLGGFGWLLQMA